MLDVGAALQKWICLLPPRFCAMWSRYFFKYQIRLLGRPGRTVLLGSTGPAAIAAYFAQSIKPVQYFYLKASPLKSADSEVTIFQLKCCRRRRSQSVFKNFLFSAARRPSIPKTTTEKQASLSKIGLRLRRSQWVFSSFLTRRVRRIATRPSG